MKVVQIGTGCAWDDLSDIIKDQPLENNLIFRFLENKGYEITPFTGKNGWTSMAERKI